MCSKCATESRRSYKLWFVLLIVWAVTACAIIKPIASSPYAVGRSIATAYFLAEPTMSEQQSEVIKKAWEVFDQVVQLKPTSDSILRDLVRKQLDKTDISPEFKEPVAELLFVSIGDIIGRYGEKYNDEAFEGFISDVHRGIKDRIDYHNEFIKRSAEGITK